MKRFLAIALGILTAIGGFVDIGDLVTNAQVGARFGMSLVWVVGVGVLGICVFAEMSGRVAAVSGRATFDLVRERLTWLAPWYRRVPRVDQRTFRALAEPVYGERPVPRVETVVWDLDEVDALLLRLTLAMAQDPRLLVVDDVDQVHDSTRRATVWSRLEALAAAGTTVVASVASLDEVARTSWRTAPTQVTLATGPHAVPASDAA